MTENAFSDRKYIKRRDLPREHAWQFQFEQEPIKESKSFADNKYGSKELAYAAARKYRDDFLASAYELGLLDPDAARNDLPIQLALSPRNTSGIVGLYREHRERRDRGNPEVTWVANYKDASGKHQQKSFPITRLGEKNALISALRFRRDYVARVAELTTTTTKRTQVDRHVADLDLLLEYIATLEDTSDVFFFLSTINNPLVSATDKQDMLTVRIGQARFRKLVLDMWSHRCCITHAAAFLTASHIKPWSNSDNSERLDPFNGIALSPVYDKAFDVGLITFEDDGRIRVSSRLALDAPLLGVTGDERIVGLNFMHAKYLAYHRHKRFQT